MSNEGEYLEMVNDLKDQYIAMKEKLTLQLTLKDAELRYFMIERGFESPLQYTTDMFMSSRPTADDPVYTSAYPLHRFYFCYNCQSNHPSNSTCLSNLFQ